MSEIRKCDFCGQNSSSRRACDYCGAPMRSMGEPEQEQAPSNKGIVLLRAGPGFEYVPVGYLPVYSEVEYVEKSGVWLKIEDNKWVNSLYVRKRL